MSLPSRGLYISLKTIFPPPLEKYIFPLPTIRQNLLPTYLLGFLLFCVYFTLLTSISHLCLIFSPHSFTVSSFSLILFHTFPPQVASADIPHPGGGGYFQIYTPQLPRETVLNGCKQYIFAVNRKQVYFAWLDAKR
jgi:hypothetical protein